VWVVSEYDPAKFRIAFVWVWPRMVACQLQIQLTETEPNMTSAHIGYAYTGLSPEGNTEVQGYDKPWFEKKMKGWEAAINHYLQTGIQLSP
jgi:hypothetical protein